MAWPWRFYTTEVVVPINGGDLSKHRGRDGREGICQETWGGVRRTGLWDTVDRACSDLEGPE